MQPERSTRPQGDTAAPLQADEYELGSSWWTPSMRRAADVVPVAEAFLRAGRYRVVGVSRTGSARSRAPRARPVPTRGSRRAAVARSSSDDPHLGDEDPPRPRTTSEARAELQYRIDRL